jgi:host factor-I protein
MQNPFESRGLRLDTTSPSFRHLQELIRHKTPVHIDLEGGQSLQGTIQWQDTAFLAIRQELNRPVVMVNREKVIVLRVLG